jgi:Leucine rich repeat
MGNVSCKPHRRVRIAVALGESLEETQSSQGKTESIWVGEEHFENIHLYFCRQNIIKVEAGIEHLQNIRVLQICCNHLTDLPGEIGSLRNLVVLFLARNKIKRVPREIGSLGALRELNLAENQLEDLPLSIRALKSLETLDLEGNPMKELPVGITAIRELKHLNLHRTRIQALPWEVLRMEHLTTVVVDNREPIKCVEQEAHGQQETDLYVLGEHIVVKKKAPPPLMEKLCGRAIEKNFPVRRTTPRHVLEKLLQAKECAVCGHVFLTSSAVLIIAMNLCGFDVPIRYEMCSAHVLREEEDMHEFVRRSLFEKKSMQGELPQFPFLFDTFTYTKTQKKALERAIEASMHEKEPIPLIAVPAFLERTDARAQGKSLAAGRPRK